MSGSPRKQVSTGDFDSSESFPTLLGAPPIADVSLRLCKLLSTPSPAPPTSHCRVRSRLYTVNTKMVSPRKLRILYCRTTSPTFFSRAKYTLRRFPNQRLTFQTKVPPSPWKRKSWCGRKSRGRRDPRVDRRSPSPHPTRVGRTSRRTMTHPSERDMTSVERPNSDS